MLNSLSFEVAPQFPFSIVDKPFPLWHFTSPPLRNNYRLSLNQDLETITATKHNIAISHLLLSLHELSVFLNSAEDGLLPWDAFYPDRVYEVEYAISLSLYDDSVIAECFDKIQIGQILLQAALLFIYSNLREAPVRGTILKTLLFRLKVALDSVNLMGFSKSFTAEVLWVLAIGTCASTGNIQAEFVGEARQICAENRIRTWTEVTYLLRSVPALLDRFMTTCMDSWIRF